MKILASDFDGTLAFDNIITDENIKKIKEFQAAGNLFGISTGRDAYGLLRHTKQYDISFDFMIFANGAKIMNKNKELLLYKPISKEIVTTIYNKLNLKCTHLFFGEQNTNILYLNNYKKRGDVIYNINELTDENYAFMALVFNDNQETLAQDTVNFINDHFGDVVDAYRNITNVDIVSKGSSKGNGIKFIAKQLNIPTRDINVIGDSLNDISMFEITNNAYSFNHVESIVKLEVNYYVESVAQCIDHIMKGNNHENTKNK